jgi:diguanylate cyclase (GGDEF)-like protein
VVLLPQTGKDAATVVAKRLLEIFRTAEFLKGEGLNLNVRVSMGVATYPEDAKNAHDIIHQADEMMYAVKNSTRDNISVAGAGLIA